MIRLYLGLAVLGASVLGLAAACGSDDEDGSGSSADAGGNPEHTGQSCKAVSDCYPGIDAGSLAGEAQCLDRVTGGYCTHLCETDDDCCKVEGECKSNLKQVCSPFESTGQKMCFLSCETADIRAAGDAGVNPDGGGTLDDTTFCTTNASTAFKCRSSGGGSKNRKVCTP